MQIDPARVETDAMRRAVEDLMLLLFHGEIAGASWRAERLPSVLPCFAGFLNHPNGKAGMP